MRIPHGDWCGFQRSFEGHSFHNSSDVQRSSHFQNRQGASGNMSSGVDRGDWHSSRMEQAEPRSFNEARKAPSYERFGDMAPQVRNMIHKQGGQHHSNDGRSLRSPGKSFENVQSKSEQAPSSRNENRSRNRRFDQKPSQANRAASPVANEQRSQDNENVRANRQQTSASAAQKPSNVNSERSAQPGTQAQSEFKVPFKGPIFVQNDWNGSAGRDIDNTHVANTFNSDPKLRARVTPMIAEPGNSAEAPNGAITNGNAIARASQQGPVAITMGGVAGEMNRWLDAIENAGGNMKNIVVVSHSTWNERNGNFNNFSDWNKVKNRVRTIKIPDQNKFTYGGGKGGNNMDISDLGMVHYLLTGNQKPPRGSRIWG